MTKAQIGNITKRNFPLHVVSSKLEYVLHVPQRLSRVCFRAHSLMEGFTAHSHAALGGHGMTLDMADRPRERATGVGVGRGREGSRARNENEPEP